MQTSPAPHQDVSAPHVGARLADGLVTVIVSAMSAFWLNGSLAAEQAA